MYIHTTGSNRYTGGDLELASYAYQAELKPSYPAGVQVMSVVSLAIAQERQRACHLRLLQTVWADRDYPQVEAYGREGQDGDSWSKGYFAHRRHYMLSALCVADLATVNIFNTPFGNNDIWPFLEKDIRIGPWTWAEHMGLAGWLLGARQHAPPLPRHEFSRVHAPCVSGQHPPRVHRQG